MLRSTESSGCHNRVTYGACLHFRYPLPMNYFPSCISSLYSMPTISWILWSNFLLIFLLLFRGFHFLLEKLFLNFFLLFDKKQLSMDMKSVQLVKQRIKKSSDKKNCKNKNRTCTLRPYKRPVNTSITFDILNNQEKWKIYESFIWKG